MHLLQTRSGSDGCIHMHTYKPLIHVQTTPAPSGTSSGSNSNTLTIIVVSVVLGGVAGKLKRAPR
jgi:hypothetical protein